MNINDGLTHLGSVSQPSAGNPINLRNSFRMPNCPLKIHSQTIVEATTGVIDGT